MKLTCIFLFFLLSTTKSPGYSIQKKHKKTLKDGQKVDWLVTSRLKEGHGGESSGFSFSLIYPTLGTEKNQSARNTNSYRPKRPQQKPVLSSQGPGKRPSCKAENFQTKMAQSSQTPQKKLWLLLVLSSKDQVERPDFHHYQVITRCPDTPARWSQKRPGEESGLYHHLVVTSHPPPPTASAIWGAVMKHSSPFLLG